MEKIQFSELIKSNKILYYFFNPSKPLFKKIIGYFFIFFLIPLILLVLSLLSNTLTLKNSGTIGFFDDLLFIFAVFIVPAQLYVLKVVLNKFISYIEDIPSFTLSNNNFDLNNLINKYKTFVVKKRPKLIIIKVIVILVALFSNIKSLYFRTGGWNSSEHIIEFILTILFLIVIFIILVEILIKFLVLIFAQIKLTTELNTNNLLDIKPLSLDKSGNLESLGELSLSFTYILIPFMFGVVTHYMVWESAGNITIGFIFSLVLLFIGTIFLFFFPLGTVHSIMKKSRKNFLHDIDNTYIIACDKLLNDIKLDKTKEIVDVSKENCENIKMLYDKGKEMPIWPFDLVIMTKFFSVTIGPIILVLIEFVLQKLIEKLL